MKLSPRQRWIALLLALTATLAAGYAIDEEAPEAETPRHRARRNANTVPDTANTPATTTSVARVAAPAAADAGADGASGEDREGNEGEGDAATPALDPFRTKSWLPPPPPPPKPSAPPLPFKYLGKALAGEEQRFFLARNDKYMTTAVGDVLDGQYLFEKAERGRLVFVYQPLKERQYLSISAD